MYMPVPQVQNPSPDSLTGMLPELATQVNGLGDFERENYNRLFYPPLTTKGMGCGKGSCNCGCDNSGMGDVTDTTTPEQLQNIKDFFYQAGQDSSSPISPWWLLGSAIGAVVLFQAGTKEASKWHRQAPKKRRRRR